MDSLFKLCDYKIKPCEGKEAKEFFIYPVDSSVEREDFKILFSEFMIEDKDTILKSLRGYRNYIIPIDSSLVLKKNDSKFPIKKNSTFSFGGGATYYALNASKCLNLILDENVVGKFESVKFYNELIIKDDIKKSKIIIFYSCDDDIEILSKKRNMVLKKGEAAIYINDDRFELKIKASGDENRIVWGKITLWVYLKNVLEVFLFCF